MSKDKQISGILSDAAARTSGSLAKLEKAKTRLAGEVARGEWDELFRAEGKRALPSPADLCEQAGNSRYFLNGKLHKGETRETVDNFLFALANELEQRSAASSVVNLSDKEALRECQEKYAELSDRAHYWFTEKREIVRELALLKQSSPPKIVPIR